MPDLGKTPMFISIEDLIKKFMLRDRVYKVLKTKAYEVKQDSIRYGKKHLDCLLHQWK